MDCSPPGSSVHGDSPGRNTGVGCHAFLQGNRPNPGIEPVSLTSPALAGGFFTTGATWEAPLTPENLPVLEMGVTRVVFRWDRVWVISSVCGVDWGAVAVLCAVDRAAGLGGVAPAPGVPVAAHVASLSGSFSWSAPCPCGRRPLWIPASAST